MIPWALEVVLMSSVMTGLLNGMTKGCHLVTLTKEGEYSYWGVYA